MPGMMRWNCSRGCCLRDSRAQDKHEWRTEWDYEERVSPDAEYEYMRKRSAIADLLESLGIGFGDE